MSRRGSVNHLIDPWEQQVRLPRVIGRVIALSARSRKPFLDSLPLLFEPAACNVISILLGNVLERADGGQQLLERLSAWLIMLRNGDST